jgi:hypothetical protein
MLHSGLRRTAVRHHPDLDRSKPPSASLPSEGAVYAASGSVRGRATFIVEAP